MATNGGYSAIYTLLHSLLLHGSSVAIEDPTALRHLDILENLGVRILPVRCDGEGPQPDSLREAIAQKPAIFLYQPRLHSMTGQTVPPRRMAEMAAILRNTDTVVIEDDGLGDIASSPTQSLGAVMPDRVVHVQSFSKTLGPDLRIAVLSGSGEMLDQAKAFRSFSWAGPAASCMRRRRGFSARARPKTSSRQPAAPIPHVAVHWSMHFKSGA